jgi:hypothetical protein
MGDHEQQHFIAVSRGLREVSCDDVPCTGHFQFNGGGVIECNSCGRPPSVQDNRRVGLRCTHRVPRPPTVSSREIQWKMK